MRKQKSLSPLALVILDGWGVGPKDKTINAIEAAKTPFFDGFRESCLYTQLGATGRDVGLEDNQMSGSEAGHLNIGAGRIVTQDIRMILEDITNGGFFLNPTFLNVIHKVKNHNSKIHLMGLMGNADSPHSHPDVFMSLLVLLKKHGLENKVFVHLFTDGRDSFQTSAVEHLRHWEGMMKEIGVGTVATLCGRFYAMDRARNWSRLQKAFEAMVSAKGDTFESAQKAIRANYASGNTDEYMEPSVITKRGKPIATIEDNDGIIFFNLRSDRARQLTKLFVGEKNYKEKNFPKIKPPKNIFFVAMTNFGPDLNLETAYFTRPVIRTLPVALSHLRQLYISETEKYAHVTYFINGGYADPVGGETRIQIPSLPIRSYADEPAMSGEEITRELTQAINANKYDFYTVNYPNADMVGHTGDFKATVRAVEFLDKQLKMLYAQIRKKNGIMVITADHGNADIMIDDETGKKFTFHTKNPVPFIIVSEQRRVASTAIADGGKLADIAPTILSLLDVPQPEEMVGRSLITANR